MASASTTYPPFSTGFAEPFDWAGVATSICDTVIQGFVSLMTGLATVTLYGLSALWQFIQAAIEDATTCRHTRVAMAEGTSYCPDCGCGVVYEWVTLRCNDCGRKRQGQYCYNEVVPADRCCRHCGEHQVRKEVMDEPDYFQMQWALLELQADDYRQAAPTVVVQAWVEASTVQNSPTKQPVALLAG
jgi:hypothetical protein